MKPVKQLTVYVPMATNHALVALIQDPEREPACAEAIRAAELSEPWYRYRLQAHEAEALQVLLAEHLPRWRELKDSQDKPARRLGRGLAKTAVRVCNEIAEYLHKQGYPPSSNETEVWEGPTSAPIERLRVVSIDEDVPREDIVDDPEGDGDIAYHPDAAANLTPVETPKERKARLDRERRARKRAEQGVTA